MSKKSNKTFNKLLKKAKREYGPSLIPTYVDARGVERWKSNGKPVHFQR